MPDTATTSDPAAPDAGAIVHFLSAVHQALDLPAPRRGRDQLRYLKLLDQRAHLARASIGRLISNPHNDALDYTSEGDHILHKLADLPPDTYRSRPAEQLPAVPAIVRVAIQPANVRPAVDPSPPATGNGLRPAPAGQLPQRIARVQAVNFRTGGRAGLESRRLPGNGPSARLWGTRRR